jgi:hypothetical protein
MITSIEYLERGIILYGITLAINCITILYLIYEVAQLRKKVDQIKPEEKKK